jgi:dTDP-4-dehydrorhamnose reductase
VKILLVGPTGQVGSALLDTLPHLGMVIPADRTRLDLANASSIHETVREVGPEVIVNAAAYTAVDEAESDQTRTFAINRDGPAVLAAEAAKLGALLVHYSTDYVFDGEKPSPYVENDAPNPLNVYGRSKLEGEQEIAKSGCRYLIFRTSWVYAGSGNNFLLTMLRLAGEGKPLRVVNDQHGAPTSNLMIADATAHAIAAVLADPSLASLYHMTASGSTTWHGFAEAAFREKGTVAEIRAIRSVDYPAPARRPRNSVLDNWKISAKLRVRLPTWETGLRQVVEALR